METQPLDFVKTAREASTKVIQRRMLAQTVDPMLTPLRVAIVSLTVPVIQALMEVLVTTDHGMARRMWQFQAAPAVKILD